MHTTVPQMFVNLLVDAFNPVNHKREPVSSWVIYFILRAYTGTGVSHSQHTKKLGEVLETKQNKKVQVNGPEG